LESEGKAVAHLGYGLFISLKIPDQRQAGIKILPDVSAEVKTPAVRKQ
jgi:hypothetical protein